MGVGLGKALALRERTGIFGGGLRVGETFKTTNSSQISVLTIFVPVPTVTFIFTEWCIKTASFLLVF